MLKTAPPDIECFAKVIERHGVIMAEVKLVADAVSNTKSDQLTIEYAAAAADTPPTEPREGLRGTIDRDGVVNVNSSDDTYEDENQVTIEQVADPAEEVPTADQEA